MKKGQSVLEYAVIIVAVVGSLIAMQAYIRKGLQGRLRSTADQLGEQYVPKHTVSDMTITQSSNTTTVTNITTDVTGEVNTTTNTFIDKVEESRQGWEKVTTD